MNVKEAKALLSQPIESNYVVINISYSAELILPHKEGLEVINALAKAEKITGYGENEIVKPLGKDDFTIKIISAEYYREAKMRHYLKGEDNA